MSKCYKHKAIVHVKQDRNCKYCGHIIKAGTLCLTINKKYNGREWICNDCITLYKNYLQTRSMYDNVDDEGASIAYIDKLDKLESKLLDLGMISEDDCYIVFN